MILKAILNQFRLRRNYIANAVDKIPPEIKDALVAWYSPYCKQDMTNFDVIEAYVEDFTTWRYSDSRGTAAVTPNKITITESFDTTNIVEDVEEPYSDISIYVTGVSEDVPLVVRDIIGNKAIITKDGKYDFSKNSRFMGFAINKILSNINVVISLLPTSILKDFSGNGNHAYLYGGKGKLNSGMGLYKVDFTTYINKNNILDIKPNSFITNAGVSYINSYYSQITDNISTFNIKVTGLNGTVKYNYKDANYIDLSVIITKDGTYNLPISHKVNENKPTGFSVNSSTQVAIIQIPDYPNQLCYDGKSYAVAYDMPILTDYTVMADRTWFEKMNRACFLSKITTSGTGAFGFEFYNEYNKDTTYSFGRVNDVEQFKDGITWQITNSYNGIVKLDYIVNNKDNAELYIGKLRPSERPAFIGCHGDILLFNRTLTNDELDLVKEHFFGIESNIKDALMTTDKKYLALVNNNYIKLNK